MKETTLGHLLIELFKTSEKEKVFKAVRKKIQWKTKIKIIADSSSEAVRIRRKWSNNIKILEKKILPI